MKENFYGTNNAIRILYYQFHNYKGDVCVLN